MYKKYFVINKKVFIFVHKLKIMKILKMVLMLVIVVGVMLFAYKATVKVIDLTKKGYIRWDN